MRRLILALVLPLLLLISQQGALRHEIGHLAARAQGSEARKQLAAEPLCEACLLFAHLAAAAKPGALQLQATAFLHPRVATVATQGLGTLAPAARSRGPPMSF